MTLQKTVIGSPSLQIVVSGVPTKWSLTSSVGNPELFTTSLPSAGRSSLHGVTATLAATALVLPYAPSIAPTF